ncbi:7305_t:CDS:2, partial [Acaulospora colombiana]
MLDWPSRHWPASALQTVMVWAPRTAREGKEKALSTISRTGGKEAYHIRCGGSGDVRGSLRLSSSQSTKLCAGGEEGGGENQRSTRDNGASGASPNGALDYVSHAPYLEEQAVVATTLDKVSLVSPNCSKCHSKNDGLAS